MYYLALPFARAQKRGKKVLLCGVEPTMERFLDRLGITSMVGDENIFLAEDKVFASTNRAVQRAKALLNVS